MIRVRYGVRLLAKVSIRCRSRVGFVIRFWVLIRLGFWLRIKAIRIRVPVEVRLRVRVRYWVMFKVRFCE